MLVKNNVYDEVIEDVKSLYGRVSDNASCSDEEHRSLLEIKRNRAGNFNFDKAKTSLQKHAEDEDAWYPKAIMHLNSGLSKSLDEQVRLRVLTDFCLCLSVFWGTSKSWPRNLLTNFVKTEPNYALDWIKRLVERKAKGGELLESYGLARFSFEKFLQRHSKDIN